MVLERLVDVVQPRDLAGLDRQVVADELVELALVGAGELQLHRAPVRRVDLLLLLGRQVHQHVVPDEVGLGQLLAGRVHGLEDELRVVHTALKLHVDDDKLVEPAADDGQVELRVGQLLPEEVEVVDHARDHVC